MPDIDDIWDDEEDRQGHVRDDRPSVQDAAPLPVGYIPLPAGLHPDTAKLVCAFAEALAAKLRLAEAKYGYSDGWRRGDWRDELVAKLVEHFHKGDPRDVAAYCAFAWYHGWSIAPAAAKAQGIGWGGLDDLPSDDGSTILFGWKSVEGKQQNLVAHIDGDTWRIAGGRPVSIDLMRELGAIWTFPPPLPSAPSSIAAAPLAVEPTEPVPVRCGSCGWLGDATELGAEGECGGNESCTSRPAEITDQADMLKAWQDSEGQICGKALADAGLIEPKPATNEEAFWMDLKVGDTVWHVSAAGKALLEARPSSASTSTEEARASGHLTDTAPVETKEPSHG